MTAGQLWRASWRRERTHYVTFWASDLLVALDYADMLAQGAREVAVRPLGGSRFGSSKQRRQDK